MIIRSAHSTDLGAVRHLMEAYLGWHHERYCDDPELLEFLFDPVKTQQELRAIPRELTHPSGMLLIATGDDGTAAGFVGLRRLSERTCEMKRMFVAQSHRGKGLGALLCREILKAAAQLGYERIVLDTGSEHVEAQNLYRHLGFEEVEAYYDVPPKFRGRLLFMGKSLAV